jgi:hypothetical protein
MVFSMRRIDRSKQAGIENSMMLQCNIQVNRKMVNSLGPQGVPGRLAPRTPFMQGSMTRRRKQGGHHPIG